MSEQILTNCTVGGPISVYVKDGKITRVRPIVIDENDLKPWTIEAKGRRFSPPKQVKLAPYVHTERPRLYSPVISLWRTFKNTTSGSYVRPLPIKLARFARVHGK